MTDLPKIKPKLREDLQLREWAKDNGWKEQPHVLDRSKPIRPQFPLAFTKGDKNIWHCRLGWSAVGLNDDKTGVATRRYQTLAAAFAGEDN